MTVTANDTDTCAFCEPYEAPLCGAEHANWTCTRAPDHAGEHVACGGDVHAMYRWGGE